jgi:Phage integrase, N-terminal SAM-like domain
MTKKKAILTVTDDLSGIFSDKDVTHAEHNAHTKISNPKSTNRSKGRDTDRSPYGITVEKALSTITRQMEISGNRPRTISDYNVYVQHFIETLKVKYIEELNADHVYEWLARMDVSKQTKLTRLKCLKAFLSRCFDNG